MTAHSHERSTFAVIIDGTLVSGIEWTKVVMNPTINVIGGRCALGRRPRSPAVTDNIGLIDATGYASDESAAALSDACLKRVQVVIRPAGFDGLLDRTRACLIASVSKAIGDTNSRIEVRVLMTPCAQ